MAKLSGGDKLDELPEIQRILSQPFTFERLAQRVAEALCRAFDDSMVLVRLFATVPYGRLPAEIEKPVTELALGAAQALVSDTPVLTLLGTCGVEPAWRDRRLSRGHAGIPLASSRFVAGIPMIARLMEDLGIPLKAFDRGDRLSFLESGVFKSGSFHVPEASSAVDDRRRRVIPDQDFVSRHGVKTVFGAGVAFIGTPAIATLICFTRDSLERSVSQQALALMNVVRVHAREAVESGRMFGAT